MKELKYLSPSKACNLPHCETYTFSLDGLRSYHEWKTNLLKSFIEKSNYYSFHPEIISIFHRLLSKNGDIITIRGEGSLYLYNWTNGEPLFLLLYNDLYYVSDEAYWLSAYPFLRKKLGHLGNQITEINTSIFSDWREADRDIPDSIAIITQNDHIGHFLYDELPLLRIGLIAKGDKSRLLTSNKSVHEALQALSGNYGPYFSYPKQGNYRLRGQKFIRSYANSFFSKAYLSSISNLKLDLELHIDKSRDTSGQIINRVFLTRGKRYKTRIANMDDIQQCLSNLGFRTIETDMMTFKELKLLLGTASVIVAECGTTTLIACLFSSHSSKVITLVPQEILAEPSAPMLVGGLPYMLAFITKLDFVCGQSVIKNHLVQTSNIVMYDVQRLEHSVNAHCGRVWI